MALVFAGAAKFVFDRLNDEADIQVADPIAERSPVACTSEMLDTNMKARVGTGSQEDKKTGEKDKWADAPVVFTVSLRNTETMHPCFVQVGRDNATVAITSGNDAIASLASCETSTVEHRQLLIRPETTATFEIGWNGRRGDGCLPDGTLSRPGTYKGVWKTEDGTTGEATAVFELPDLEPEPAEEAGAEDESAEGESAGGESPEGESAEEPR